MNNLVEELLEISKYKNASILNIDKITNNTIKAFKLDVKCNNCDKIKNPSIKEFTSSRRKKSQCKCSAFKLKINNINTSDYDTNEWKDIDSILTNPISKKYNLYKFKNYYLISKKGIIVNSITKTELKQETGHDGYKRISLCVKDEYKKNDKHMTNHANIHILVACAFLQNNNLNSTLEHIDKDRSNNNVDNLRWVSKSDLSNSESVQCSKTINIKKSKQTNIWLINNIVYHNEKDVTY